MHIRSSVTAQCDAIKNVAFALTGSTDNVSPSLIYLFPRKSTEAMAKFVVHPQAIRPSLYDNMEKLKVLPEKADSS